MMSPLTSSSKPAKTITTRARGTQGNERKSTCELIFNLWTKSQAGFQLIAQLLHCTMNSHHSIRDLVFEHFSSIFARQCPHFLFTESNAPERRWRHDSLTPQASWYFFPTRISVEFLPISALLQPRFFASEIGRRQKFNCAFYLNSKTTEDGAENMRDSNWEYQKTLSLGSCDKKNLSPYTHA